MNIIYTTREKLSWLDKQGEKKMSQRQKWTCPKVKKYFFPIRPPSIILLLKRKHLILYVYFVNQGMHPSPLPHHHPLQLGGGVKNFRKVFTWGGGFRNFYFVDWG